jgi:hypothetical protein
MTHLIERPASAMKNTLTKYSAPSRFDRGDLWRSAYRLFGIGSHARQYDRLPAAIRD